MADFEGNMLFPDTAATQSTIAAAKRWQSKLITSSGTFVVPDDVGVIWVDGCAPGEGGAGGHNADPGGGGCGGGPGQGVFQLQLAVTPGDTLTFAIGPGGTGGLAGSNGSMSGSTYITSALSGRLLTLLSSGSGVKGTVSAGGIFSLNGAGTLSTTDLMNPSAKITTGAGGYSCSNRFMAPMQSPGVGGAPNVNGLHSGTFGRVFLTSTSFVYSGGGVATASLGGGGAGGHSQWGTGGAGGAGGVVGANATGYGAGGGGGGGNAAGGNGSPGFLCLYVFSATTI